MRRPALAVLMALCAAEAGAQTTSTLAGEVRDASGAALSGVTVTAHHLESGLRRTSRVGA